jgi:hypothetical protein
MLIYFVWDFSRFDISRCKLYTVILPLIWQVTELTHAQFLHLTICTQKRANFSGVDVHFRCGCFQIVIQKMGVVIIYVFVFCVRMTAWTKRNIVSRANKKKQFGILNVKNTRMPTFATIFLKQLTIPSVAQKKGNQRQMTQYKEPVLTRVVSQHTHTHTCVYIHTYTHTRHTSYIYTSSDALSR